MGPPVSFPNATAEFPSALRSQTDRWGSRIGSGMIDNVPRGSRRHDPDEQPYRTEKTQTPPGTRWGICLARAGFYQTRTNHRYLRGGAGFQSHG